MSAQENREPIIASLTEYDVLHALEMDPSAVNLNRAAWFYADERADFEAAGRLLWRAAVQEPWAFQHRLEMGRFLSREDRAERAVTWLQSALRLALSLSGVPAHEVALIYLELAHVYRKTNRPERYYRYLHLSLQACPGYKPARRLLEPA